MLNSLKQKQSFRLDVLIILLLSFTAPLFFYKLGQSSLANWDEAWYAEIARNIFKSGDLFRMSWNGSAYFDHPPFGFWLMALIYKIFGVNEFWTRFTSAITGFGSIFLIYFLGKELFNRTVGFASAIALSSAIWFIYRARTGNLDITLTMLFILTFYLALRAVKGKAFLIPFGISLACLFLTKTLVPFTIIPPLLIIFWGAKNIGIKDWIRPSVVFLLIIGSWFIIQLTTQTDFIGRYFSIGLPGVKIDTSYLENIKLIKEYLHSGIGKWFWPGVFSMLFGAVFLQKRFIILSVFLLSFIVPFLFSSKGHIWHLVPLYPFLILAFFGLIYTVFERIFKAKIAVFILVLGTSFYFSFIQIRQIWYQFIDIPSYVSDEAILSKEAGKYPQDFYIDGDFSPVATFYSGKHVNKIWDGGLEAAFKDSKGFMLITYGWRLEQAHIKDGQYSIIKTDRDKILIQNLK